jgi:ribosomal protein S18 acetylase RimI-like enzyme
MTDVPVFGLRRARASDYDFVVRLYLETMQPLLMQLKAWDETEVLSRFKRYFRVRETQIINFDGRDVGFLQVSETPSEVTLAQIHIEPQFRHRGIGTFLVQGLLRDAAAKDKPVLLSVVRGNRARGLYERLGFLVTGEEATKLHMRWESPPENADRATNA